MQKNILGSLGLLAMLCACNSAQQQSDSYVVEGELNDSSSNGKMVYISRFDDNELIDSTLVEGNKFVFKGNVDTARFCRIDVTHGQFANFILESGHIKVNLEKYNSPSGTQMNDELNAIAAKADSIYKAFDEKRKELRAQYTDDNVFRDSLKGYFDSMAGALFAESVELFKKHGDDAIGEFLLRSEYFPDKTEQQEIVMKSVGPWLKSRRVAQNRLTLLEGQKNTAEGKPYVDIKGKNIDGKEVALSDYVGKGNYVLMDMWASWCGPCRGETPNLAKLHQQFKDKGLTVLGMFVWDKEANLKKTLEEEKVAWPQIFDSEGSATDLYGVNGIPQIILFAPDGTILKRDLRGKNMIQTVTELMNKK